MPAPYLYLRSCHLYNGENLSPAIESNCAGVTSNNIAREAGNCCKEVTIQSVCISPPDFIKQDARALVICCAPPFGKGQPLICASMLSTIAMEEVVSLLSGNMECAAMPAKTDRAALVVK